MKNNLPIAVQGLKSGKVVNPMVALELASAFVDIYRIIRAGQETRAHIAATEDLLTKQHDLDMTKVRLLVELIDRHAHEFPSDLREEYYRAIPVILTKDNIKVEIKLEGKSYIISNYSLKTEYKKNASIRHETNKTK